MDTLPTKPSPSTASSRLKVSSYLDSTMAQSDLEETALTDIEPIMDENLTGRPICKVRASTNASGKKKDRSQFRGDQKLKELLANADEINSIEHFTYWKDEFLETFRNYLDDEETCNAREADEKLYFRMQKLAKMVIQLKDLCKSGSITPDYCNVKGQRAINEFIAELASSEKVMHVYFPKKLEDELAVKYNKFNLAAVLVRDGFRVYDLMITTRDYIVSLRENEMSSENVLSKNHNQIIQFYLKEIESFCDCLADLGMYKLMNKCVELYKIRPRNRKKKHFDRSTMGALSDTDDDETTNAGRMFRRRKANFRSIMDDGWMSGVTGQEVNNPDEVEQEPDGRSTSKQALEEELPDPTKPNEWIYYYDPNTDCLGKIPREKAVREGFVITADECGKEKQDDAVQDWDGPEGKTNLIWTLKNACKGKGKDGARN
jgi:hypothetical protein